MFAGNVIFQGKTPYLRTVDDELLVFLWKGQLLDPDDLWLRMLICEHDPVHFMGIRIGNTFNALHRTG